MKNSIILAIFILFISIGWFVSGQIGKVNAQDEQASINNDKTSDVNQSEETIQVPEIFEKEHISRELENLFTHILKKS